MRTRHARLVDYCSLVLERHGATPVPRAPWWFRLGAGGPHTHCWGCEHPMDEHGATGECWHLKDGRRACWCRRGYGC